MLVNRVHETDDQDRVVQRFRTSALSYPLPHNLDCVILYLAKFILYPVEESESAFNYEIYNRRLPFNK